MHTMHAKLPQSCLTLCDPMDCSLPGSTVHGGSPGKNTGVGCQDLPDPGIEPKSCLLHWQAGSLPAEPPEKIHFIPVNKWLQLCNPRVLSHYLLPTAPIFTRTL